ncbi:hypothetical protein D3C72_1201670 [compost metagenome]
MAVAFGKADQRHAPDPQAEFDKGQPHQQVDDGVEEVFQPFRIHRVAPDAALRFEGVAAYQAVDDHAQHQQNGTDQRLAQGGAGVAGGNERREQGNGHQHQRRHVPEGAENRQGVVEGAAGQAPGQRLVADQVGDRPAETQDEAPRGERGQDVGGSRGGMGQMAAEAVDQLRIAQRFAKRGEAADQP